MELNRLLPFAGVCVALAGSPAIADTAAPAPAEFEGRTIKALSAEDAAALEAGHGMGLGKAAELNHYPGPAHVLGLAEALELTPEQRSEARALEAHMREGAQAVGRAIVSKEAALDALFASGKATAPAVRSLVGEIAGLQGELRFAHLAAHIEMRSILSEHQIVMYDQLRGHGAAHGADEYGQ